MFDRLINLLNNTPSPTADTVGGPFDRKQLAVAALLVEVSQVDRHVSEDERAAIARVMSERFPLDAATVEKMLEVAQTELAAALEDWVFTEAVRAGFSRTERVEVVGMLWEVVYADGRLARLEEDLVQRLTRALDVGDEAAELARSQAFARVGLCEPTEQWRKPR